MAGINFIMHAGKRMLYLDFTKMTKEEFYESLKKARVIIDVEPEKSLLVLVNVEGATFDTSISGAMKEFSKANTPYVRATAVYGMTGLMTVIFRGIMTFTGRKNLAPFDSLEKAKDYLAGQK